MARIHAIDAVRGLCLINIFINHITLGQFQRLSPLHLTLCDSAEIFVFLAGVTAALVYAKINTSDVGMDACRIWRRSVSIYATNVIIIILSFAILYVAAVVDPPALLADSPQDIIRSRGAGAYWWHLLSLQQSIGYSMVLRLYVILTLVTPLYICCAVWRWWLPLLPALVIWLVAGHFSLVLNNSLTGDRLALTILPWNLVYAAGICLGRALVQGIRLPRARSIDLLAAGFLVAGVLAATLGARCLPGVHDWYASRNEFFWTGGSKTLQSPLRVLSLFALVWIFLSFRHAPVIRLFHRAGPDSFLCRLGRRSLQVFSFGAVFALLIDQGLRLLIDADIIAQHTLPAALIEATGIAIGLLAMRWIADHSRTVRRPSPMAYPEAVAA